MRFSVLTPTYYSERFSSLDAIAEHLFSPERMSLRFHLFESLVLPSLMAQSDAGFDLVILTAERLPEVHFDRLQTLLEDLPHIHLRRVGTARHYQLIKDGYNSIAPDGATHRVLFRLDDDDAVDLNYIRRVRRTATALHQVRPASMPQMMAFNRGFYLRLGSPENEVFDAVERAPLSTGTALLAPVDYSRNPYRYNHRQLAQHYTCFSDIGTPSFIRTIHGDNKSNPTPMGLTGQMKPAAMRRALKTHFGLGLSDLKAL